MSEANRAARRGAHRIPGVEVLKPLTAESRLAPISVSDSLRSLRSPMMRALRDSPFVISPPLQSLHTASTTGTSRSRSRQGSEAEQVIWTWALTTASPLSEGTWKYTLHEPGSSRMASLRP